MYSETMHRTMNVCFQKPFRSTWIHHRFLVGSCCSIFSFPCSALQIFFLLFVYFSFGRCIICSSIYNFWSHLCSFNLFLNFVNITRILVKCKLLHVRFSILVKFMIKVKSYSFLLLEDIYFQVKQFKLIFIT